MHLQLLMYCSLGVACLISLAGCSSGGKAPIRPMVLVASGDTAGWIVPCGCTANQSGGLLRRGTYLSELEKDYEVVYVDVGGALAGVSAYDRAKFAAILEGEREMNIAAHNIGLAEARLGYDELRKLAE